MITNKQIDGLVSLTVAASKRINELRAGQSIEVNYKGDKSPVSTADYEANDIIITGLKNICPDIPIVSEEIPESHGLKHEKFFIIDPLDGTKVFLRGDDEFTVNIALIENSVPVLGILSAPALNQLYFNIPGEGVYVGRCFEKTDNYKLVRLPSCHKQGTAMYKVLLSKVLPSVREEEVLKNYQPYQSKGISSSLKFALLAVGKGDIYPRFGPTKEWDTAAGHALLLASGGTMIELPSKKPFHYGKNNYWNPPFLALASGIPLQCK